MVESEKRSTEEGAAIPESWRGEIGHELEEKLFKILENVGIERVDPSAAEKNEEFDHLVFFRTTPEQDFNEKKGDFAIYDPAKKKFIYMDLTTSTDPKVHSRKRVSEKKTGTIHLPILRHVIHRASLGSKTDIQRVLDSIGEAYKTSFMQEQY